MVIQSGINRLIYIIWDGARYVDMEVLRAAGRLPTLNTMITNGSLSTQYITDHTTWTDPGHSQMFGGYSMQFDGTGDGGWAIKGEGLSIFKQFKLNNIYTVVINSRESPSVSKDDILYKGGYNGVTSHGYFKWNFMNEMKYIDYYWSSHDYSKETGIYYQERFYKRYMYNNQVTAEVTNNKAKEWLLANKTKPKFFMFMHFGEPDSRGHGYTSNSPEYLNAIVECDRVTGDLINFLQSNNMYDSKTMVIVSTDHGFFTNSKDHSGPPYPLGDEVTYKVFFVADQPIVDTHVIGNQADTAPTLLALMNVDWTKVEPPYDISKPLWLRTGTYP